MSSEDFIMNLRRKEGRRKSIPWRCTEKLCRRREKVEKRYRYKERRGDDWKKTKLGSSCVVSRCWYDDLQHIRKRLL